MVKVYNSTNQSQRERLIKIAMIDKTMSRRKAAKLVGINYSNAKKICNRWKVETEQGILPANDPTVSTLIKEPIRK